MIAIHGWQDNAGSFDRLIPLLPENGSYLCIDLPGHGLSSRIPNGFPYYMFNNIILLQELQEFLKIEKVSLLTHSMGSILAFLFASIFPEHVNMVIGIDFIKPFALSPKRIPDELNKRFSNFMTADKRNQMDSEPPSFSRDELIKKLVIGYMGSINEEVAPHLLERAVRESKKNPGKFFLSLDGRVKHSYFNFVPHEVSVELAKRLNMPYLFFRSNYLPFGNQNFFNEIVDIMKANPNFEMHYVDAGHHMHLTDPEIVAPIMKKFMEKHWRPIPIIPSSKL